MSDLRVESVALTQLHPDPDNPRRMGDDQLAALMRSITRFGQPLPIVVRRRNGRIIGGHHIAEALRRLGRTEALVSWWEGPDADAHALNLALNRIDGEREADKLAAVLADLAGVDSLADALGGFDTEFTALTGFSEREILTLLASELPDDRAEDLTAFARDLPAASASALVAPGGGYHCGAHVVIWGDARDADFVASVAGEPHLLFSDPPCGVDHPADGTGGASAGSGPPVSRPVRPLGPLANDDLAPDAHAGLITAAISNAAAVLQPGGALYLCGAPSDVGRYAAAFAAAGLVPRSLIIWRQEQVSFGRRDYQSQYELIWYGWTRGRHRFFGGRAQSDIWTIPREPVTQCLHPAQKPVALARRAIENSSQAGETVLDLFGGSGTTLIAAELSGRRAVVIDCDPHSVAVAACRWQALTGRAAAPFGGAEPLPVEDRDA